MHRPAVDPSRGEEVLLAGALEGFASPHAVAVLTADPAVAGHRAHALAAAGSPPHVTTLGPDDDVAAVLASVLAAHLAAPGSGHPGPTAVWCTALDRAADVVAALPRDAPRAGLVVVDGVGDDLPELCAAAGRAGYRATLFDGACLYLVATDSPHLAAALRDAWTATVRPATDWRGAALDAWGHAAELALTPPAHAERSRAAALEAELAAMRATLSWRVTRPLRAAHRLRAVLRRPA